MIVLKASNQSILKSGCEALCVPVSESGTTASGVLAVAAAEYPAYGEYYRTLSRDYAGKVIKRGHTDGWRNTAGAGPRYIYSMVVKQELREQLSLEAFGKCLRQLARLVVGTGIKSVAIPAPGRAMSAAEWKSARQLILLMFKDLPDVRVEVYPPYIGK